MKSFFEEVKDPLLFSFFYLPDISFIVNNTCPDISIKSTNHIFGSTNVQEVERKKDFSLFQYHFTIKFAYSASLR